MASIASKIAGCKGIVMKIACKARQNQNGRVPNLTFPGGRIDGSGSTTLGNWNEDSITQSAFFLCIPLFVLSLPSRRPVACVVDNTLSR